MIRTKKDIKKSLLKRAISQGRGADVILLIQWRKAVTQHEANKGIQALEEKIKLLKFNQEEPKTGSRCLDAFNLKRHIDGSGERLVSTQKKTFKNILEKGNIRLGISFVQAHAMFHNNSVLVKHAREDGSHYYVSKISDRQPVLH